MDAPDDEPGSPPEPSGSRHRAAGRRARRLAGFGTTIFAEMTALAARTGAINLGQGFPDTDGPTEVADAAIAAIRDGHNQYPPGNGIAPLRSAIGEHQRRFYGLEVDADREVLVTVGATEAIAAAMLALVDPGDEVVMFEPYYDSYAASVAMAGGVRRVVPLHAPHWGFDEAVLRSSVGPRTRMILLNSPHNPTGKVFDGRELALISDIAMEHDLIVVADEVYEHLAYDSPHLPICSVPGMWDRTLSISSGGKSFSFTGWKIGWATGPAPLVDAVRAAKQYVTYASAGPFQYGIAAGLRLPDSYFDGLRTSMMRRRDQLADGLAAVGLEPFAAAGGYFLTTDVSRIDERDAESFCRDLPRRCGVVAIPSSVFYDDRALGRSMVRWAFCKRPDVLAEATLALGRLA